MPGDEQGTPIPLAVFGGLVTDQSPPDTPEGVSPDCQDVEFLPGLVKQRPCLRKIFTLAFPDNPVYQKTFVQPDENPLNLFIDAANDLYKEDVNSTPGTASIISNMAVTGIRQSQSVTAFGREYIACSDGRHGVHIPLQYDGSYLDRVSQDGPGSAVQAADVATGYAIAASPTGLTHIGGGPIQSVSQVGTLVTAVGPGLFPYFTLLGKVTPGDQILVAGIGTAGYNGTFTLVSISASQLTYNAGVSGLAPDAGGGTFDTTITFVSLASIGTTTGFHGGQAVTIAGATDPAYDGTVIIKSFPTIGVDSQFYVAVSAFGLADSGGGTVGDGGTISAGIHGVVVLFLTRQGYITKPSPRASWTAAGNKGVQVSNIPIPPPNVVARIVAFTGAGGANYFYIPTSFLLPGSTTAVQSTVITDNTVTSAIFNFTDNALFAATSIDVSGRNYFAQHVLGECIGAFSYASRMFWWGERNKVDNFLNMGFEGGVLPSFIPGWGTPGPGLVGAVGGAWISGVCMQITDDGSNTPRGLLSQSAYQDENGVPILLPSTQYSFRLWANCSVEGGPGSIVAELESDSSGGVIASATIPLSSVTSRGGFYEITFTAATPDVIPSDLLLKVYEIGAANGTIVNEDELNMIPTANPYRDALFRVSYVNAPEQFDSVTGVMGSTTDASPIRNCFQLRNTAYYNTAIGKSSFTDNGTGEPSTWAVPNVTQSVGALSIHSTDPGRVGQGESGEQWEFTLSQGGVYVFAGGEDMKVSQEIQEPTENGFPGWNSLNPAAFDTAWVKNDTVNRRCYIGVATGTATAPNLLFVLDYRNLDSAWAISQNPPVRSFGGRNIASDTARKWTRWSLELNCGEILARPNGDYQIALGAGNGQLPGTTPGFGNAYLLDSTRLTDDDYGTVVPYWTSYFFPSNEIRAQYRLGAHRLTATYLTVFASGTGLITTAAYVNSLLNLFATNPNYTLRQNQFYDWEWDMWVAGERIAIKVGSIPDPTVHPTDNAFSLQDLTLTLKKEPWAAYRGTI